MMFFGVLYSDVSGKMSETELIDIARKAFERRAGTLATLALLCLSSEPVPVVDELFIVRSHLIRHHHTIVGIQIREENSKILANPKH